MWVCQELVACTTAWRSQAFVSRSGSLRRALDECAAEDEKAKHQVGVPRFVLIHQGSLLAKSEGAVDVVSVAGGLGPIMVQQRRCHRIRAPGLSWCNDLVGMS